MKSSEASGSLFGYASIILFFTLFQENYGNMEKLVVDLRNNVSRISAGKYQLVIGRAVIGTARIDESTKKRY